MPKLTRYEVFGASIASDGPEAYQLAVYVVEHFADWQYARRVVEDRPEVRYLLGVKFPSFVELEKAKDYVKGRNDEIGLCYDQLEVILA